MIGCPAPALRPFISHYAGVCAHGVTPGVDTGLPSRHAHLVISLGAPISMLQMPGPSQRPDRFQALVSGLHDAPAIVQRGTSVEIVHVFLTPLGIRALLGISAREVASRVVDLSDVWGRGASAFIDRLREAAGWEARFAVLDEVFDRALMARDPHPALLWTWRQLASSHGCGSIEALARATGWSRQYLTERFHAEFGLSPKTAGRIFRFERACRLIKDVRPRLVDVAIACGYHDQAHMTREWQALAGCSPGAWIASELPFLQDYELAGGDHDAGADQ